MITQNDLVTLWAKKAGTTKTDTDYMLKNLISVFEDLVLQNCDLSDLPEGDKSKTILKVKNFGRLSIQRILPRKGSKGRFFPETRRVTFKLARNIRHADKFYSLEDDGQGEEDETDAI